jgi:YidC/Oxa1 family membrane protein insertase
MQQRNFVWFMILSFLILIGWVWIQNKLWPPKPRTPDQKIAKVDWKKLGPAARAVNLIAGRGLPTGNPQVDYARLSQDLQYTPPIPQRRWDDLSDTEKKIVVLLPPPLATSLAVFAQFIPRELPKAPEPDAKEIKFGSDKTFLQGSFTTRGAGVRKLTLNKFQAANWLGEPTTEKLELIPDDPEVASFLMYHYPAKKEGKWDNPVSTLGRQIWNLDSDKVLADGTQEVRFSTYVPEQAYQHLRIVKTYKLAPRDYHLTLLLEIQDDSKIGDPKTPPFRYQLTGAHGLPIEGIWYTSTYRDAVIGVVDSRGGLARFKEESMRVSVKQGGEKVPDQRGDFLQYAGVHTQYFGSVIVVDNEQPSEAAGGVDKKNVLEWARPTLESVESKGILRDADDKFAFISDAGGLERRYVLLPRVKKQLDDAKIKKDTRVVISFYLTEDGRRIATWIRTGESPRSYLDDLTVRVNSELLEFNPGRKIAHQFLLYHGPVKTRLLGQLPGDDAVDPDLVERYTETLNLRTLTDYGKFLWWTSLLIEVTKLMHLLLYYLHFLVGGSSNPWSYGLTIILLTVLVRGLMFPISKKQAYFSVKMQEIAPELKKLKEKYPNDRKAQTEATMELYRKHGVSPLGSCLPLLMQMPIFLGLYYALQESIHFRLAPFLWINNLAAPDMLLWWTEKIPWISEPDNLGGFVYLGPFLNLLPLFAVALMIVQQKMMTPPPQDEQQATQQKLMKYMMVVFGILFYKVASGLCIYFISSSLWGLAERRLLPKKKPALALAPGQGGRPSVKPGQPPTKGKGPKAKGPSKKDDKPNGTLQKVKDWWAEVLKQAKKK